MKKNLLLIVILFSGFIVKAQWTNQDVPIPYEGYIYDMEAIDNNTSWGVLWSTTQTSPYTQDFVRTTDGGTTWTLGNISTFNLDNVICNIWPIDSMTAYACTFNATAGVGGNILKTTDGGATWVSLDTTMFTTTSSFPDIVYFWDPAHGMAMGDPASTPTPKKYEIYTTSDSGATWTRVPAANLPALTNTAEYGITNLFSAAQGYVWFGTTYGAMYRSKDMGITWAKRATGFAANTINGARQDIEDVAFTDSLKGIALQITSAGAAYLRNTFDGGDTWTNVTWVGSIGTLDIDAIPGTNILISTGTTANPDTGVAVFSIDNGLTWTFIDSTLGSHTAVDFASPLVGWTGQYVLATMTGGAWKWSESTPVGYVVRYAETKETQVYPNPAKDMLNVIGASDANETKFEIIDMQGKVVLSKLSQTYSTYHEILNVEALANGFYVLRVTNSGKVSQHKFVKE
jgi:photosystem II stability/assembly factor-like uncharacterized protein